jgi:hypothetical protein
MAKQSSSLLTRCFRSNKMISTITSTSNSDIKKLPSSSNTCRSSSIIETIQIIDQMVQATEDSSDKQKGDSHCIQRTMNIEQIEEMLIKWTHIAHFLVDTYRQMQTLNEQSEKDDKIEKHNYSLSYITER